jgi:hypothetical protein
MARTTGNIFTHEVNKGIMIPPIGFFGIKFPHITAIATEDNFDNADHVILKWRVKGSDTIHTYIMPNRQLTTDEITTILVVLRMS